jgi:hypothetical protein
MNINRHTYESWFILYMDNELTPAQREAVEVFVQKNPDLKDELDLLLQFKLNPDTSVVYEGKENLMMPVAPRIEDAQLQEWLVLYMDNELDAENKIQLETLIATDPSVRKEWEAMQRTRLEPETIVFPGKQSLYRSEEKVRRMAPRVWRVAAAVILFLMAGTAAVIVFNNRKSSSGPEEIVTTKPEITPSEKVNAPVTIPGEKNIAAEQSFTADRNDADKKSIQQNSEGATVNAAKSKDAIKNNTARDITPTPVRKDEPVIADNNPRDNNLPQPLDAEDPERIRVTTAIAVTNVNGNKEIQNRPVTNSTPRTSDIILAKDDNVENDGASDGGGSKKSSLRGFFRKVTRNVEKRTGVDPADSDNRLLIGGLAIKLK